MNQSENFDSEQQEFTAHITAVTNVSGTNRYTWEEVIVDGTTGAYVTGDGRRAGDSTSNYMLELNNQSVAVPSYVRARLRGCDVDMLVFEFEAPAAAGGGGGTITVQNKDGTQLGTASSLVLDQTTGLRVLNITSGAANLQNDAATVSGAGVVSTAAQTWTGSKGFQGSYNFTGVPQAGTNTVTVTGNEQIGEYGSGVPSPFVRARATVTSGSGAGADRNCYLSAGQLVLGVAPLAAGANGVLTPLGPGACNYQGALALFNDLSNTAGRRATLSYASPNFDFTLYTSGVGQVARFVVVDNAGTHAGASNTTGGLTFVGGIYTGGTATGGGVPTTRAINTTAPLTGGGDLSADRTLAVLAQNSVTAAAAGLQLVNDAAAPGNSVYYGTDKTGTRGYYALPVSTQSAVWRYSTNTTMADPSAGNYRINTGLFTSATTLAISSTTDAGTDVSNTLKALAAGDTLQIQDQSVAANWVRYKITSAVNNTTWFQFGVSYVAGGGAAVSNNTPCLVTVTLAGGGTGGAGTVTSVDVSGGTTGLTTSGGPVTTSGTITIAGTLAVASGGTGSTSAAAALTALGAAPSNRTISTTAPLAGGGDLTANRTFTVSTFTSGASGVVPASGGGTTNFLRADGTWAAAAPTTRAVNTTAPLAGGGDLSADRTLSITNFTSSAAGAVPASGGGTSAFLRADGAWAAPPGGGGAGNWPISSQSASFTAATTATSYYCSSASASITATLPPAAGNSGLRHRFTKTSASSAANLVTVKGNAAESINSDLGAANTLDLYYQADTVTLECDGAGWWVIDDKRRCHVCTAARALAQSIADSTVTTIVLDTGVVDGLGLLSGGGISIKRAGRYALSAYWLMQGTNVQLYLVKAGPVTLARHLNTSTAATALIPNTPLGVFTLAAGDTLFLQGFQGGTGAAQNTRTGQDQPLISVQEVR